ncbi:TonB-dependent receptor family protein [Pseudomarimonas salicorniae]|uniref:TonB-dependent receptor n=1 Tax=Pseudomarimonas salicorniae TaxID=2933270 RepID=A0ABT0GLX2_9GAMM|nr:TonB-dependent receptor [Lysobacter sp. CAU 1642]MCK7595032.1 TonB-dependent receptor [Lysobacter sp. CAU 1642]
MPRRSLLCLALAAGLNAYAHAAPEPDPAPEALDRVVVRGQALPDPRFPGVAPSIEDGKVKAGKKSTRVELAAQPTVVENALRRVLARVPGVLVSELQQPAYFNLNYRGLGDPHESEFITGLENGLPIASDWFGYPTLYYLPPIGRVDSVEFIRGGSALMYGPQPGPSLNFVTRRPRFGVESTLRSDHVVGSDSLYQTFSEAHLSGEHIALIADVDHRAADGERDNADYEANAGRVAMAFRVDETSVWDVEFSGYESESGEPGRLTSEEFANSRELTKTPFNRVWIDREAASLANTRMLTENWSLHGVYRYSGLDRTSRRSSAFVPPAAPPSSTTFDRQQFNAHTFDLRAVGDIGEQHTLSAGVTVYRDDSPRERLRSGDLEGGYGGSLVYRQARDTRYAAAFVEAILRFDALTLVPALRYEDVSMGIKEQVQQAGLTRAPIDRRFDRNEALAGFGALYELGGNQQVYANVSQGYRPMRFDDIGNPSSNLAPQNDPDPARALNIEFGLRGSPMAGVYYDVSAFRIDLDDKIEQRQVNVADVLRINSGDSRHQGVEASLECDVLNPGDDAQAPSLLLFANAALLDAEITRSENAALIGNEPAFAPERILRAGAQYRSAGGLKLGLTASHVSDHFWQDSNGPGAGGAIAAVVPSYTVVDLSAEMPINENVALLGGVGNALDEDYYSRVRSDGIEPAQERSYYLGVSLRF